MLMLLSADLLRGPKTGEASEGCDSPDRVAQIRLVGVRRGRGKATILSLSMKRIHASRIDNSNVHRSRMRPLIRNLSDDCDLECFST